jgi:hypothetical protein
MKKYIYSPRHHGLVLAPLMTDPTFGHYPDYESFEQDFDTYNTWLSSPPIYKVRPEDIEWFSVERGEDEFEDVWYNFGGFDKPDDYGALAIPKKGNESKEQSPSVEHGYTEAFWKELRERFRDHAKEHLHFTDCDGRYKAGYSDAVDFSFEWFKSSLPQRGYSEAEVRVHNKTQSGYSYRDYEEEEHLLKDRIIAYLSGREKGDGIEWAMVYEMMDAYLNVKIQHKGYTAIDLDQVVYDWASALEKPEKEGWYHVAYLLDGEETHKRYTLYFGGGKWYNQHQHDFSHWLKKTTIRQLTSK